MIETPATEDYDLHVTDAELGGACVQTLRVSHESRSRAQIAAEIRWNLPAGRALVEVDAAHKCIAVPVPPDPLASKRARLAELRAKGWANLSAAERDEANALRFDLGLV